MSRVDAGGHLIEVEVAGEGPPDFACIHGLADTRRSWDRVAPALAERGRVIRFDQRAHGASDSPAGPCSLRDLAADAVTVLDAHRAQRAILVGHSLGGVVAMEVALEFPERVAGLVLIGTADRCSARMADWYERLAVTTESEGLAGLARELYGDTSRRQITGDAPGIARITRALKSLHETPLTPRLRTIRCPVLLVVGEKDLLGPKASEGIRDRIPGAVLRVMAGRGHWAHLEDPPAVLSAIDDWLGAHGLARAA